MRIVYLCQYFPPEIGAPSARVGELSQAWAELGHDVCVITAMPNHPTGRVPPAYQGVMFVKERRGMVEVWRNWLFATPNEGFVKKTLSHLSFMFSSAVLSTPRLGNVDVLIVSSPTFFSVLTAWFMSRTRGIPFVFEVRDLWPGVFIELGVLKNRLIIRILESIELFLYRASARVVVVTDSFARSLKARGIPASKLVTITNGVDCTFFAPGLRENEIRAAHGLSGKFVVLYIGAHGISHALSRQLDAAEMTAADPDICWVFVGEGADKAALVAHAQARNLTNVRFVGGQPRELMPSWYAACDAALVPLRDIPLFEGFIPSKMFEIMACGRPMVASVRGEARRILDASGAALTVDPEDAGAVASAVRRLRDDPELCARLGASGRRFAEANYERKELARKYATVLEEVVAGSRARSK
ncbi:MAG: glycosyltransferase family 4 protein [Acidobacteriota bacterium]|nr:glycosyltransferase family 4 protein [Acidobacteriota bacterium]